MARVEEHYKNLLAEQYAWIYGGLALNLKTYRAFFGAHTIKPHGSGTALDLGAGCGFQSIPLAEAGFKVIAIDLNTELLEQLKRNAAALPIVAINDNLLNLKKHCPPEVEIIVCMGDTLTHLNNMEEVGQLITMAYAVLEQKGLLILGFRDMSTELTGLDRFIPVRSDEKKIFTCFLEFESQHVKVHDIVYEKVRNHWKMNKSFFRKLRISLPWIRTRLQQTGFSVKSIDLNNGMAAILARKS